MRYELKVYRKAEGVLTLGLEAADAAEAAGKAEAEGYRVLSSAVKRAPSLLRRRYRFPLSLFSQELLSLLAAGIPLLESLETLGHKERHAEAKRVFESLIGRLREGQPLSKAMEALPETFPPLYAATIRAAERTGDLKEALSRYLAYHAQLDAIRRKVLSASLYPALLVLVGGLVVAFLLAYVVPRFSHIYEDMGENLPLLSKALMVWGRFFYDHWAGITVMALSGATLLAFWLAREPTRQRLGELLWRIPAAGKRLRIYQFARFYRTVGMLLRGGIPLVTALEMAAGLLGPGLRLRLGVAVTAIREGQGVSESLEAQGLTTEVASRMLRVGERSGNLGEMMERAAAFYDDETGRWMEWFTRLFEPLLMVAIGLAIGLIVVLLYLPIFELAGSIR